MKNHANIIRQCYAAYETKDRAAIDSLLTEDFTFSSPIDDNISRGRYFERCWPNSAHLKAFRVERLFVDGDEAFAQYEAETTQGAKFRNTEFFTFREGKIAHVDVYFGSETAEAATQEEIRAVVEAWTEAIRQKDVAGVLSHFAKDSVRFYLAPPLQATQPLRENLEGWFGTFRGGIGYEIRDLTITTAADLACCHSFNRITGTKVEGETADVWFRETLCLRKIDGQWLITHAHESVPFYMDGSVKAAMDLKPS